jgi:hypothetical protein
MFPAPSPAPGKPLQASPTKINKLLLRPEANRESAAGPKNISNRVAGRAACHKAMQSNGQQQYTHCFGLDVQFYNQELTSGQAESSSIALLFLLCIKHKSRTDSELVAWESFRFEMNFSITLQRAAIIQESPSTPHPDLHKEIGNPAAPTLAASRVLLLTTSPPSRPSPAVAQMLARQRSLGDA